MTLQPAPLCLTCVAWRPYPRLIAGVKTEAWRCHKGVQGAPARTDCLYYMREPGSESW